MCACVSGDKIGSKCVLHSLEWVEKLCKAGLKFESDNNNFDCLSVHRQVANQKQITVNYDYFLTKDLVAMLTI